MNGQKICMIFKATLSKVFYLELTCSNLKVFSSRRMCTNLKQKSELNSLFYYSVLTFSNAFSKNTDSKIHISNPYINLLNLRIQEEGNLVYISLLNLSNYLVPQDTHF